MLTYIHKYNKKSTHENIWMHTGFDQKGNLFVDVQQVKVNTFVKMAKNWIFGALLKNLSQNFYLLHKKNSYYCLQLVVRCEFNSISTTCLNEWSLVIIFALI